MVVPLISKTVRASGRLPGGSHGIRAVLPADTVTVVSFKSVEKALIPTRSKERYTLNNIISSLYDIPKSKEKHRCFEK